MALRRYFRPISSANARYKARVISRSADRATSSSEPIGVRQRPHRGALPGVCFSRSGPCTKTGNGRNRRDLSANRAASIGRASEFWRERQLNGFNRASIRAGVPGHPCCLSVRSLAGFCGLAGMGAGLVPLSGAEGALWLFRCADCACEPEESNRRTCSASLRSASFWTSWTAPCTSVVFPEPRCPAIRTVCPRSSPLAYRVISLLSSRNARHSAKPKDVLSCAAFRENGSAGTLNRTVISMLADGFSN